MTSPISGTPSPSSGTQGIALPGSDSTTQTLGSGSGVAATSGAGSTPASGATNATQKASAQSLAGTDTFLKLLVAQLRNQDPMQPMDDQSFITELAQFNTVEQLLNVKQSVDAQSGSQQAAEAMALLGKEITYTSTTVGGDTTSQGLVSAVSLSNGQPQLQVGQGYIPLSAVTSVQEAPATPQPAASGFQNPVIPVVPVLPFLSGS